MLVVIFYNLFLYISVRDISYLYYVLYVAFFTTMQLALFGFAFEHLWPDSTYLANKSLPLSLASILLFITLFSNSFLNTKIYSPVSYLMLKWVGYISVVLILVSVVFSYRVSIITIAAVALLTTPLPLVAGVLCWRAGFGPARFYLFAWLFLMFGCLAYILKSFGILPNNMITNNGAQIGSALEVILLSFALGDRINYERREKLQAKIEALEYLEQSSRLKDEFMATISHELRTPLNGVSCSLALIEQDYKQGLDIAPSLLEAESSAFHMQSLIDDLLCFSEAKNNALGINEDPFNLNDALKLPLYYYQKRAKEKGIEFNFESNIGSDLRLIGDQKKLVKVITHLLDNAIKFTDTGWVTFRISTLPDSILVEEKHPLLISVIDTGRGIPADKHALVYEAFSQADSSFTRNYGGLGIGLAICGALVKIMGGTISFNSSESGSRFDIVLYFAHDENKTEIAQPITSDQNPLEVLVVEDNPVNQVLLCKLVKNMGHKYTKAENGEIALEAFKKHQFDIVLMDCQMPVMDGFTATRKIRELGSTVPIIAVTANALDKDRRHCKEVGMNDFIAKPVRKGDIEHAIARWARV